MSNLNDVIDHFLKFMEEDFRRGQFPRNGFKLDKLFDREKMFSMNKPESDLLRYISWEFNRLRRNKDEVGTFEKNMSIDLKFSDLNDIFSNDTTFRAAIKYFVSSGLLLQKKPRSTTYFFNPFVINNFTDKQNQALGIKPVITYVKKEDGSFEKHTEWLDPKLINDKLETF